MSEVKRWKLKGFLPGVEGECKAVFQPTVVMADDFDRVTAERDALQQRLTAADEWADVLEGLLREARQHHGVMLMSDPPQDAWKYHRMNERIDAALKPAEGDYARMALRPENQRVTPVRFKCLACGEYHEGSGNLPCPSMSPYSRIEQ